MPEHPALSSDIEQNLPPGYHVVKLIGKGNFGIVYKAKGPGGREWAFKITDMSRGRAVGIKEFKAFRNVRRIKPHRNLIEYYGVWLALANGEFLENAHELSDDDLKKLDLAELIIQMPLAEESLEKRLKKARRDFNKPGRVRQPGEYPGIPLRELLVYMQGVAEALDHLHSPIHPLKSDDDEEGTDWLLHRDVKPGNILIDRTGNVLVADYGVARAVGANVTGTQGGAGTPIYSAPEQLTDHVPDPHPSSDQYSLAITYYELRTGSLPIPDESMSSVEDVKLAQILGRLDFSILPRNEVSVLRKATSKVMKQRYSSCCEFVAELYKANGVAPGRVSGIMPGPAARMPYSDGDIQLPPLGEMSPRADSRTPFEMGTMPEIPPALRDPESPPPPEKQSGTHRVEELVRSTQFTPPATSPPTPVSPPAAPPIVPEPVAKEELPLADEANPWDQPAKPVKGKSTADFAVPPVKGKSTPDLAEPPVKPKSAPVFELPPDFIEEPKAPSKTPKTSPKMKGAKETGASPYGTVDFGGVPPMSPKPKPASNPVIDIDEADSKPPTWIPQGQPTKKKISPMVWLAGGAGLAATVAAVIFALKPGPSVADGGGGSPPPPPPPPPITTPPLAPSFLADASASLQAAYSRIEMPPPPPKTDLTAVRGLLSGVIKDERIQKENVKQAVALLAEIKDSKDPDTVSKDDAEKLHAAWAKIDAVLGTEKPSLAKAEEILALPANVNLKADDRATWDAVHLRLRTIHPTAAERLAATRVFLRGDSLVPALGASGTVLTNVGRLQLAKLKELADADPSFSNDSTKATTLITHWNDAFGMLEPKGANATEIGKWRDAIRGITLTGEDKAVLTDFYRVRLAGLVQRFALKPVETSNATDWSDLLAKLPTDAELPGSPWNEWLKAEARVLEGALRNSASRTKDAKEPGVALPDEAYRALVSAELKWNAAESLPQKQAAATALVAIAKQDSPLLGFGSRKRALGVMMMQSGLDLKAKPTAIDSNYAASDEDNALARNCLAEAKRLLDGDADAPSKLKNEVSRQLMLASAFPMATGKPVDQTGIRRELIADAPEAEKNSLWLAFARTRNRATPPGLDDALHAYKQLVAMPDARRAVVEDLLKAEFRTALKAKGSDAVRDLYLPLLTPLFNQRGKLADADSKQLAALLAAATELSPKDEELAVMDAFVKWETNKEPPLKLKVDDLRLKNERVSLLRAFAKLRAASSVPVPAEKIKRLEESVEEYKEAVGGLRSLEPKHMLELLDTESLEGYLELGRLQADGSHFTKATRTYFSVELIAGKNPKFAGHVNRMLLGRAKVAFLAASDREAVKNTTVKDDLDKVIGKNEADTTAEACYWRAVYALYVSEAIRCDPRKWNYENDKLELLGHEAGSVAGRKGVDEALLQIPASLTGPYAVELLEWRACFACAKAHSTSDAASLQEARKELDLLAKVDPLAGAVRRLQFQVSRLESGKADDSEWNDPEIKTLTRDVKTAISRLAKSASESNGVSRIENGVPRDRLHLSGIAAIARMQLVSIMDRKKPSVSLATQCLDELARPLSDDSASAATKATAIELLESLAGKATTDAGSLYTKKQTSDAMLLTSIAVNAFHRTGEAKSYDSVLKGKSPLDLRVAGKLRRFAARLSVLLTTTEPQDLGKNPATLDLLMKSHELYNQAEKCLEGIAGTDSEAKTLLDQARDERADLKSSWFDKGLDGAIKAAEDAGDTKRASDLKKFQAGLPK